MFWPCRSSQCHGTARLSTDGLWATCSRSASSGYHAEFHEGCYQKHTNLRCRWPVWNQTTFVIDQEKSGSSTLLKDNLLNCWTSSSDISGYHSEFHERQGTIGAWQGHGRGTAWERHRHGMLCVNRPLVWPHLPVFVSIEGYFCTWPHSSRRGIGASQCPVPENTPHIVTVALDHTPLERDRRVTVSCTWKHITRGYCCTWSRSSRRGISASQCPIPENTPHRVTVALDHIPLDEGSARHSALYLKTHNTGLLCTWSRSSIWGIGASQGPVPENTQHSQVTVIPVPGGIFKWFSSDSCPLCWI